MARGGARPNAGRKPGTLNRFNRELLERATEGGQLPLDYMLEIMRDQSLDTGLRIDAGKMRRLINKVCLGEDYIMNEARQIYRPIGQPPTANLALVLAIILGPLMTANAQISDYQECSDGLDLQTFGENLTAKERIALMDEEFETELFDTERCENSNSGGGGSGGASGGRM